MQIVRYNDDMSVKEIVQIDESTGDIVVLDDNLGLKERAKVVTDDN